MDHQVITGDGVVADHQVMLKVNLVRLVVDMVVIMMQVKHQQDMVVTQVETIMVEEVVDTSVVVKMVEDTVVLPMVVKDIILVW